MYNYEKIAGKRFMVPRKVIPMAVVLEAKELKKTFGKAQALDGVNLAVEEGEIYGFIGPNGAGKSTTIRILLGILKASEGTAKIFGEDAWKQAVSIHQRVAYVPGDVNLWPNLSGGETIDVLLRMKKGQNKKYREELIELFNFDPTKKCRAYSKGNRQKVALIAAFSSDADLFILDEPTSGLDPLMEIAFRDCVTKAKAAGKTVFLSSHILSEVERLCDRLSIIRKGKIIDSGSLNGMRHLSRNRLSVDTPEEMELLAFMPGVHNVQIVPPDEKAIISAERPRFVTTSFQMDNDKTNEVFSYLLYSGATNITSTPPTLEELFMSHYGI